MNKKKLSSALKKVSDDETQTNITDIIQKRRISFSGRKLVREFCGEEETKAWKDSYEESDRSNNSEAPLVCNKTASIRSSDSKLFHQKSLDSSESPVESFTNACNTKYAQKTFLSKTIDYVNSSCHISAVNFCDTLHVTLTEKEKQDFFAIKNQLQSEVSISQINKSSFIDTIFNPNDSQIMTKDDMQITKDKADDKVDNHTMNMDIDISHVPKNPQKNRRQTVRSNQDMDISLSDDKENIPVALQHMDIETATHRIDDTAPMHISLHVKGIPNKELQKTMYYNNNIDGVLSDATVQPTMSLQKTILFHANDVESNIDVAVGKCDITKGALTIIEAKTTTYDNDESCNPTNKDNSSKTTNVDSSQKGVVVRRIMLKTPQSKSKDVCNSNNKRWEKYKGNKVMDNEANETRNASVKMTVVDNEYKENCKSLAKTSVNTEPLNTNGNISNLSYDPFASIFPDSDDGINDLLPTNKSKMPTDYLRTKDISQIDPSSVKNVMNVEIEKLRESALTDNPTAKMSTYKNKLPRYSQADELLLDNTSYLTKAKLGDETSSRNSSKYTPASLNKEHEIITETNATKSCMEQCESTKPDVCKSLNFTKMLDSVGVTKENVKANKLDLTEDFAQPLSQTIMFNSSDDIDISTIQSIPSAGEVQSTSNRPNIRHTMLFSDDIELESNDPSQQQIKALRSVNKSTSKPTAKGRETLLMREDIELVADDNAKYLETHMNSNPTVRRNTLLVREDIEEDEMPNKLEVSTEQAILQTKGNLNINELDKRQYNTNNLSSLSKPTARRNIILMREDIPVDEMDDTPEIAEQHISIQTKEYLDKNTQNMPIILKPTTRRNTILMREDMHLDESDDNSEIAQQQAPLHIEEYSDENKSKKWQYNTKNVSSTSQSTARRNTILMREDIPVDEMDVNEVAKHNEHDKVQNNTQKLSSISKPTARRNTILMREDMHVDEIEDKLEDTERQTILQMKEHLDENEFDKMQYNAKNLSSKSKSTARRNTMLLQEDIQLEAIDAQTDFDKLQQSIQPNSFKTQRDASASIADNEMATQIQKSILAPTMHTFYSNKSNNEAINESIEIEAIKSQSVPKRHTIYEHKDMQLEANDESEHTYDSQSSKSKPSNANCIYMTTTPRRNYDSTPQRSFLEFVNNELQTEMSIVMEEQDNDMKSIEKRRQTICRPIDMDGSFNYSEMSKKRLALHLTPNVSVAKKRQTYDCELDESQTTQTNNMLNSKTSRRQMQTPFNKNRLAEKEEETDDMHISPVLKSLNQLNISLEMELEEPQDYTKNVKYTSKFDSPQKAENAKTNSIVLESNKTQFTPLVDNVKCTPVKTNLQSSRIPVPIGSSRKSTPKISHKDADESDVYIIDDDFDELETIPHPRKAMTAVPRSSTILPEHSVKLASQKIADDNQELLHNTMVNVSRFRQSLNILDFDDIDKTNMSLVGTLDAADSDVIECSNVNVVDEVINAEQKPADCYTCNPNASEMSAILCRKCKRCQDTILNETAMSSFALPKHPVIPFASLEALRKIRQRPKLIDVHNYYRRLSLAQDITYHHDDTIVLGTAQNEPEDEVDALIADYRNKVEQNKREVQASIAHETRPYFVERFQTLLKSHTKNWIFDFQKQNQNIYLFYHRKIKTSVVAVMYDDLLPLGKDIRVQNVQFAKSFHAPEKHWKPINYVMNFQLQLESSGVDLTVDNGDHSLLDMLLRLDKIYMQVRRLSMALWKMVIQSDASLVREGSQTYIRKVVCTVTCQNGQYPKVNEMEFRIRVMNVKKISYKDIILPPLHMFHENIQLMPTGLEFVREFLKEPKSHLRNL